MLDVMFARRIGHRLDQFNETSPGNFLFRCPICGDSKKSKWKKRGTLYTAPDGTGLIFGCYNCGESTSFGRFLERIDPELYRDYKMERFKAKTHETNLYQSVKTQTDDTDVEEVPVSLFDELERVSDLPSDHPAVVYLQNRCIDKFDDLYYTDNFSQWINGKGHFHKQLKEMNFEPRIVVPLITKTQIEFGVQGRTILDATERRLRFITMLADTRFTKSYGAHRVDFKQPVWVVEGAFDSLFFDNGLAALDGNLSAVCDHLRMNKDSTVILHDNEPRNEWIVKHMRQSIAKGYQVAFWPSWAKEHGKDVNDVIKAMNGDRSILTAFEVYSGLTARMKFNEWLKQV